MQRLAGKVAVITGGASGIGRATAELFTAEGARVVLADIDGDHAAATAAEIGERAMAVACDVADPADVEAAVRAAVGAFGGLDIMFNNAGMEASAPLVELSEDVWQRTLAVNLTGIFHGIKYAAPAIAARDGGAIISTASVAGFQAVPNAAAYCATKAGVLALTRSAAIELRASGIRVNAIAPGFVQTPMVASAGRVFEETTGMSIDDLVAMRQGRWAKAREVANAALHLAGEESSFTSGLAYVLDNGMSVAA